MIDASVLRILHCIVLRRKISECPASERIGRKAIIDEIIAPVSCESPFFQVPDGALFFFLQASVLEILTRKSGTLPIFPYMLILNFCAKSAERQSSSYLYAWYWCIASDAKKVTLAYFFYMVHLEAENGKEQIYFHRDNTLTECVICVKKCELEQMITNFLICINNCLATN